MPQLRLPDPDTGRLSRSPLELVVCQVRHETRIVVGEGSTALALHAALGGPDGQYPNLEEATGAELNLVVGPGVQDMRETKTSGWRFSSDDRKWLVTVMPDHFALETTAYTTWDADFGPRLEALIEAVAEHVRPTVEQRIGLRYVDRITELSLTELAEWQKYVRPELLGIILHPDLGPAVRTAQQHVFFDLGDGAVAGLRHGPVRDPGQTTVDYQLDYDLSRQGGRQFDLGSVKGASAQFNLYALQLFQATITDDLLEALR